jgi:hypothetical protein
MSRTCLTADTTIALSSGISAAIANAQATLDLCGHMLTFQIADGNYADSLTINGTFVGQAGPGSVVVQGNTTNPDAVVITPPSGKPAFSLGGGAMATVQFLKVIGAPGCDTVQVSTGGILMLNTFNFGDQVHPWNDLTIVDGSVIVTGPYGIEKTTVTVEASYGGAIPSNEIYVASVAGLAVGMSPHAPYIPIGAVILAIDPIHCVLTIDSNTTGPVSNTDIQISTGGQAHVMCGLGGKLEYDSNDGQAPFQVLASGNPSYKRAMFFAIDGGVMNLGASWSGQVCGWSTDCETNAVIRTGPQGLPGQGNAPNSGTGGIIIP